MCWLFCNGRGSAKQGQPRPVLRGQAVLQVWPEVTVTVFSGWISTCALIEQMAAFVLC